MSFLKSLLVVVAALVLYNVAIKPLGSKVGVSL